MDIEAKYIQQALNERAFMPGMHDPNDRESPIGLPHSYLLGQLGQNWIDNINKQIEQNGKDLLDSINKAKQKNTSNMNSINRKRRKSKQQNRPQSSNYMNAPHPVNANEAFKSILNKKVQNEFLGNKNLPNPENMMMFDAQMQHHNKSCNPDFMNKKRPDVGPDLTEAQIALNHK